MVFENSPSDRETWSNRCHVGIQVDFISMLHSLLPMRPLLVLMVGRLYWGLQMTSSFSIWSCILKGCLERYVLTGQILFEGHWRLQSWTLHPTGHFNLYLLQMVITRCSTFVCVYIYIYIFIKESRLGSLGTNTMIPLPNLYNSHNYNEESLCHNPCVLPS